MAKKRRNRGPRRRRVEIAPHRGALGVDGGGSALEVDGVVQSVTVDLTPGPSPMARAENAADTRETGYWELMLPAMAHGRPRRALIVGLGGGTVATLLAREWPGMAIVGIERDETVLSLARLDLGLDTIPGLQVVVADAFAEVPARAEREPGSYDYICLDLYEGARLVPGTLATAFLRQLAVLLAPQGTLAVNLVRTSRLGEQVHRLARVFVLTEQRRARGNVVVHARLPKQGESDLVG